MTLQNSPLKNADMKKTPKVDENATMYSCVFVHDYLVCCASNGMICVWDSFSSSNGSRQHQLDVEIGQKRSYDEIRDGIIYYRYSINH